MTNVILYDNLFTLIANEQINSDELFTKCGISKEQYDCILSDQPISLDALIRIAEELEVSVTDIFEVVNFPEESECLHLYFLRKRWAKFVSVPITAVTMDFIDCNGNFAQPLIVNVPTKTSTETIMNKVSDILYNSDKYKDFPKWNIKDIRIIPYHPYHGDFESLNGDGVIDARKALKERANIIDFGSSSTSNIGYAISFVITEPKKREET